MSDEKKERENKAVTPKREKKLVRFRYLGGGFLPGVPARNLSAAEAQVIGIELLDNSPLYERVEESA